MAAVVVDVKELVDLDRHEMEILTYSMKKGSKTCQHSVSGTSFHDKHSLLWRIIRGALPCWEVPAAAGAVDASCC